jgi:hypothetical protein
MLTVWVGVYNSIMWKTEKSFDESSTPNTCRWASCVCKIGRRTLRGRMPVCADVRFLKNVTQVGECLEWTGTLNTYGYGQIAGPAPRKQIVLTHVYAWVRAGRKLPNGGVIRHRCDNPVCVRIEHLIPGTQQNNVDDTWARGRENPRGRTLNVEDAREIRRRRNENGESYKTLAAEYGVGFTAIARVCTERTWKEVNTNDVETG